MSDFHFRGCIEREKGGGGEGLNFVMELPLPFIWKFIILTLKQRGWSNNP